MLFIIQYSYTIPDKQYTGIVLQVSFPLVLLVSFITNMVADIEYFSLTPPFVHLPHSDTHYHVVLRLTESYNFRHLVGADTEPDCSGSVIDTDVILAALDRAGNIRLFILQDDLETRDFVEIHLPVGGSRNFVAGEFRHAPDRDDFVFLQLSQVFLPAFHAIIWRLNRLIQKKERRIMYCLS